MKHTSLFLRNYKAILLIGSIAVFAVCCKSTKSTSTDKVTASTNKVKVDPLAPIFSDVAIAQAHWAGTTMDYLNQGYSIFNYKCTTCHEVKMPQDFSVEDWNSIMPKMGRKARLDSTEYNEVFHYILTKREAILGPGK
jgi:cytochrome c5